MVCGDRDRRLSVLFHQLAIAFANDGSDQGSDHTVLPRAPPAVSLTRRDHGNTPRDEAYLPYRGWVLDQGPSEWSEQTQRYLQASKDVVDEELNNLIREHEGRVGEK
jgi:hypothetical protein